MSPVKEFIKSIPILGWFVRWTYNILRINNTKYKLHILEQRLDKLSSEHQKLNSKHQKLNSEHQSLNIKFRAQEESANDLVRKHISSQLIYFHQKIDTFIENADEMKAKNLKNTIEQDFFDEYYLNFENKFRGTRESILQRYKSYLRFVPFLNSEHINSKSKSLDIGCGRGEWVELLQEKDIDAHGIDMNPMMLKMAKENNLKNIQAKDAFEYLKGCEENSFDLITAFHIIEHIPFEKLVYLLQEVKRVAKPNATILLETPNPQNLQVAAYTFYTDPTHLNPLPANMIRFLVEYLGFIDVEINYLNPKNSSQKSQHSTPDNAQDYLIVAKNSLSPYDKVKKKLFFDISLYHKKNLGTGIHRVVSEQLEALQKLDQDKYEIIPVYLESEHKNLNNNLKNLEYQVVNLEDHPLYATKGDILFTSDLSYSDIQKATESGLYDRYKKQGVKIAFLVHDILPIQHEEFFAKGTKEKHEIYIKNLEQVADLLISTTEVGKKDLEHYFKDNTSIPKIDVLHLGSNISSEPSISNIQHTFLMVGTLEPRKAHAQVIKAFDIIWKDEVPNFELPILVIIGKKGWLMEETINMIKEHPLLNKNLFYVEKANDQELLNYYNKADTVIIASYAEGFGLPLVEAMHYKKHIIARDIPVFHEIAGNYPNYFKNTTYPNDISDRIKLFLNTQYSKSNKHLSWEEHSTQLINKLFSNSK